MWPQTILVSLLYSVQDVHTACGNGVTWSLQQRHGNARHTLASGITKADRVSDLGTHWDIRVEPGDIIATGTAAGVGMGLNPPRYIAKGDVIRVEIDGVGQIENRFI